MLTLLWISAVFGSVTAMIAQYKGAPVGWWLLYGFLLWPIALPHILTRKSRQMQNPPRAEALVRTIPR